MNHEHKTVWEMSDRDFRFPSSVTWESSRLRCGVLRTGKELQFIIGLCVY